MVAGTLDVAAADMVLVPVAEPPEPEEAHPATTRTAGSVAPARAAGLVHFNISLI